MYTKLLSCQEISSWAIEENTFVDVNDIKFFTAQARIMLGPCVSAMFVAQTPTRKTFLGAMNHIKDPSTVYEVGTHVRNSLLSILSGYRDRGYGRHDIRCLFLAGGMSTQGYTSIEVLDLDMSLFSNIPGIRCRFNRLDFDMDFTQEVLYAQEHRLDLSDQQKQLLRRGYEEINVPYDVGVQNVFAFKKALDMLQIKPMYDFSGQRFHAAIKIQTRAVIIEEEMRGHIEQKGSLRNTRIIDVANLF